MNELKIALFGFDAYTGQIPRYREAVIELGHKLTFENPDIIYANDPGGYQAAIQLKKIFPSSFLILHVLDIPWHHSGVNKWIQSVVNCLKLADAVTVNSQKVKKDLLPFFSEREPLVTFDVSKDVFLIEGSEKKNDFLYVGRANDPIKRIGLVRESLKLMSNSDKNINICGSENPGFGNYLGIIKDSELNKLYNETKFVLLPSKNEGIGLSMIEGMICGSVPIMCSDNLTAKEFSPKDFICDPSADSIKNKIEEINKDYQKYKDLALQYGKKYKIQFNKKTILNNLINIFKKNKT